MDLFFTFFGKIVQTFLGQSLTFNFVVREKVFVENVQTEICCFWLSVIVYIQVGHIVPLSK